MQIGAGNRQIRSVPPVQEPGCSLLQVHSVQVKVGSLEGFSLHERLHKGPEWPVPEGESVEIQTTGQDRDEALPKASLPGCWWVRTALGLDGQRSHLQSKPTRWDKSTCDFLVLSASHLGQYTPGSLTVILTKSLWGRHRNHNWSSEPHGQEGFEGILLPRSNTSYSCGRKSFHSVLERGAPTRPHYEEP